MTARALLSEISRTDVPVLPANASLSQIDRWDSLATVRLVLRLEEVTGRRLGEGEIDGLRTIGDIEAILASGGS
jgi:acyl carrier protein